jgi:ADP-dependent NAD(P)H-hydrate dehydratase
MTTEKEITVEVLKQQRLPKHDDDADKEARGRILIVGGSLEQPGGVILAALAALRAGVGKLRIATCKSLAIPIGVTLPESRVFSLKETDGGHISSSSADQIVEYANQVDCILIGPGMVDQDEAIPLMRKILNNLKEDGPSIVLDAIAFSILSTKYNERDLLHKFKNKVVITPHIGEAAALLNEEKEKIAKDATKYAQKLCQDLQAVVALKGSTTHIVSPENDQLVYLRTVGSVGLATSGSGDILAGLIAGVCAQGIDPLVAAMFGSYLHGKAGNILEDKIGRTGFYARELLDVIPQVVKEINS